MHSIKLLLAAGALALAGTSMAQTTTPSSEELQSCLLGTPAATWSTLKLTSDQLKRVQAVQEACKEECNVAGAKRDPNSISTADGNTIMSELDNILSEEQYDAWVAYCAGHKPGAPASK